MFEHVKKLFDTVKKQLAESHLKVLCRSLQLESHEIIKYLMSLTITTLKGRALESLTAWELYANPICALFDRPLATSFNNLIIQLGQYILGCN
jgi:hypothetical protein